MSSSGGISKFLTLWLALGLTSASAFAGNWAKLDAHGNVINVIVADKAAVSARRDGPWRLVPDSVGIGYRFDGRNYHAPTPIEGRGKSSTRRYEVRCDTAALTSALLAAGFEVDAVTWVDRRGCPMVMSIRSKGVRSRNAAATYSKSYSIPVSSGTIDGLIDGARARGVLLTVPSEPAPQGYVEASKNGIVVHLFKPSAAVWQAIDAAAATLMEHPRQP